ncbi:ATP-binding protein [Pedobacter hartonius]|uniref:histidine kinase n=1 Tax=Pedobacter hartonius TaxID=425514 RepID=A0A1H4B3N5_9SPHI|nr:ATP-binding protein [Pedobacter hartonius]SEA42676.1 Bacteriophytochrome (light-regulated signal transduction histidine kinase) [Pedobacter hartonius]
MNLNNIDLTNCDREPIHIPGRIQSHGFVLAVDSASFNITYASENCINFVPLEAKALLGTSIGQFEQMAGLSEKNGALLQLIHLGNAKKNYEAINPYPVKINGADYYLIISVSTDSCMLEFEPVTLEYDIQNQVGKSISEILKGKTLRSMLHNTAEEIKEIINYDRVMIYRFLEDGHGEVIAEVKNEDLEPFFGLHYPASDIPRQARELYKLNYTRIIADVNADSSPILTYEQGKPLDLTHSALRAVSPIHIQYLKNMGVESSFSISLMAQGELWGLVACHNYSPKFIDYRAREGVKLIGKIVSSALAYKEDEELEQQSNTNELAINRIGLHLTKDEDLLFALTGQEYTIKDIIGATGAAVLFDSEISTVGETPDEAQIRELVDWLMITMEDAVYYTHRLPEVFHPAKEYKKNASGIISAMISKEMNEIIIWFRPEKITSVNWAGNPEKPVVTAENGLLNLSPRNSFKIFSQLVENTALKWTRSEVSNVMKLRDKIINAITKKAGEIRILNERLRRAYEELDTFSYTISHDLRTPLTSIKSYTELVIASNKSLDEQGKLLLGRVVAGADKMNFLINEILKLARVGRADMEFVSLDMDRIVRESAAEVISSMNAGHVLLTFGELPSIKGAELLVSQVFTNLIGNAVKYSVGSAHPLVHIEGVREGDEIIYKVEDNGIGIDISHHDKVFELFKRMENVKDIQGTGVGLAIVKRIVEKHNARVWFESELKVGTIFYVAFRK